MGRGINLWDKINLLPHRCRKAGWILFIPGLILSILRFYYGIKPTFLEMKVFAIYSSFLVTNKFKFITNNMAEEIAGLLVITGLFLISLSKEKNDKEDLIGQNNLMMIRLRSLIQAMFVNYILIFLSILFIFGFGFITVLILNLISLLIFYIIIFKINLAIHIRKLT